MSSHVAKKFTLLLALSLSVISKDAASQVLYGADSNGNLYSDINTVPDATVGLPDNLAVISATITNPPPLDKPGLASSSTDGTVRLLSHDRKLLYEVNTRGSTAIGSSTPPDCSGGPVVPCVVG